MTNIRVHPAIQILLALAVALVGLLGLTASLSLGQGPPVVSVTPAQSRVALSETVRISITIQDVSDLGAFQLDLVYSPTLARADGAAITGFLGSTGRNIALLGPTFDQTAGRVTLGAFSFGSAPGPDGDGVLAVITLTTYLTPGVTPLTLQNIQLLDTHANALSATLNNSQLIIGNRAPLTPSEPVPAHLAETVPLTPTLQWQCSDPDEDPLTYTIAFGADNPPPLLATGVTTTTYHPGNLTLDTTYYWVITATDGVSETSGPLWAFTTIVPPPEVDFTATPRNGDVPLTVQFTSTPTNIGPLFPPVYAWDFGDGSVASTANPTHTYQSVGSFDVTLVVTGSGGTAQAVKLDYITVSEPMPQVNFSATPRSGTAPLTVQFTSVVTNTVTNYAWTFGDGVTSTLTNPSHTYTAAGTYTVALTVSGPGGQHTVTKNAYITVMFSSVSGAVRFWENSAGVPGVQLTLAGTQIYSATSATSGDYLLGNVLRDSYILTPAKSDDADGITAYDASFVLRHAAGLLTLEGAQATAADVNRSGGISSLDASYILQRAVNLIPLPFPGADVVWDFDPATRSYPDVNGAVTGQDFTAILLGDVSGNWAAGNNQVTQTAGPAIVEVRASVPDPQGVVTATVWVDPDGIELYGLDLSLSFNPTAATVLAVELGPQGEDLVLLSNTNQPGEVRIGLAGALPVASSGTLLILRFQLTNSNQGTPLTPMWGQMNEGAVPVELRGAQLGRDNWTIYLPLTLNRYGSAQLLIFEPLAKPLSSRLRSR